jgi:hypothetical protein
LLLSMAGRTLREQTENHKRLPNEEEKWSETRSESIRCFPHSNQCSEPVSAANQLLAPDLDSPAQGATAQGGQWATDDGRHIFLKEMEALLASVASAPPEGLRNAAFVTDGAASNHALRRGHSPS